MSERIRVSAAIAAALFLGGCANLIPPYARPAAPVAAAYPQETTPASVAGVPVAADIEWQRFFADPRLQRLIGIALRNNRDLRIAVLNIEQARAAYQVRRADELPSVGAGVSGGSLSGGGGGMGRPPAKREGRRPQSPKEFLKNLHFPLGRQGNPDPSALSLPVRFMWAQARGTAKLKLDLAGPRKRPRLGFRPLRPQIASCTTRSDSGFGSHAHPDHR